MKDDIATLKTILSRSHTIAFVGLSASWNRPSFFAAKYMQEHGYKIIPVNPKYGVKSQKILGEVCYSSLLEIPIQVDIVDVFRRTEDVLPFAKQAVEIRASCLWQQLGVRNKIATRLISEAGLVCIEDRCVKIEHARIFGGLNWVGVNTGIISAKRLS